jgi:membrane protein YqaA with SNARE-associated domain
MSRILVGTIVTELVAAALIAAVASVPGSVLTFILAVFTTAGRRQSSQAGEFTPS